MGRRVVTPGGVEFGNDGGFDPSGFGPGPPQSGDLGSFGVGTVVAFGELPGGGEDTVDLVRGDEGSASELDAANRAVVDQVVEAATRYAEEEGGFENRVGGASLNIHDLSSTY